MADLEQWQPAVPDGQQLIAAAPMFGEWHGPALTGWKAGLPGIIGGALGGLVGPVAMNGDPDAPWWWVVLALYLVLVTVGMLFWRRSWRRRHPRPTGMAAALDWKWGRGPVLLVTGASVLQTEMRNGTAGRARPHGPGREIPGLVAVDAVDERLVLRFEDGSEAWLRQRWPLPGAAARVAELAAPVLRQRQPDEHQTASAP